MERSIEIDALWRGTSLMGLPHASTNLSQAAESPEDALDRIVQDPEVVSLYITYYSIIILLIIYNFVSFCDCLRKILSDFVLT